MQSTHKDDARPLVCSSRMFRESMALVVQYDGGSFINSFVNSREFYEDIKRASVGTNGVHAVIEMPQDRDPNQIKQIGDLVFEDLKRMLRPWARTIWIQRQRHLYQVGFSIDVRYGKGSTYCPAD